MRIAIYQNDNIGDLVVVLPFILSVRTYFTGSTIILYGNNQTEQLAQLINIIDEFRNIQKVSLESVRVDKLDMCFFLGANLTRLVEDMFLDAQVPIRIGMRKFYKYNALTSRVPYPWKKEYGHMALLQFDMLRQFGIQKPTLDLISQRQHTFFNIQTLPAYLDDACRYVILHTKSNKHGKEWPIDSFNQLKQQLIGEGLTVVFSGSEAEKQEALRECPSLLEGPSVIDLFGKTSITEFFSLLKRSKAMVCSGTGPLHLAAALNVPTIGLFPPYVGGNAERWAPLGQNTVVLEGSSGCKKAWYRKYLTQRQCNKTGNSCACMHNISVEKVYRAVMDHVQD